METSLELIPETEVISFIQSIALVGTQLWDDIQELVSDMKTALHTQARIRHMHVAGIIHQPSRSRGVCSVCNQSVLAL